jgi:hypothetical protein
VSGRRNVQCAGQDTIAEKSETGKYDRIVQRHTEPCGWKGRRKNDEYFYGPYGRPSAAEVDDCPRCGGRVELIPTDGAP